MVLLPDHSQETMKDLQEIIQPTTFLSFVLFLSFLLLLNKLVTTRLGTKLNLPPSPPKLPIIGNIHQLGNLPHRSLRALAEKYGPLMLLQLGGNPILVVSSAETAKELFKLHDIVSCDRPTRTAAKIILYGGVDLGFAPYGEFYKQARRICVHELLSLKKVQLFQFVREEETADLIDRIRRSGDSVVNLSQMLIALSSNVVSRCVLGRKVEEADGRSEYGQLTRKLSTHFTAFSFGDLFRSLEWLDHLTGLVSQSKSTAKALNGLLDKVVEEHKLSSTTVDDDQFAKRDFVDILLQIQKDEKLDLPLTQDNIKAILLDMFVGATDSSATTIEWLMTELVRNPNIMKKAQEEVQRTIGKKSKVETDDIGKMTYLECVFKETLRLHPVSPLLLPRKTSASFELGNYHIPANTGVLINAHAIQTDPKSWERPEEFLPERFENNKVDYLGEDFHFIPFGAGRRSCPGMNFGVAHVKFVTANLLYWFDWKLPVGTSSKDLDMSEVCALVVSRKTSLSLVPTLYSH